MENGESERTLRKYDFYIRSYSPSNRTTADVVVCDRDLNIKFSRSNISYLNISETVSASVKMPAMNFTEVDIRHRMSLLRMLYSVTLI